MCVVSGPGPVAPARLFLVMPALLGSSNSKDRDDVFLSLVTSCDSWAYSGLEVLVYLCNSDGGETGK